jgi:hypothetical protein
MPGKKVPERHSGLRPFEEQLPEWHPSAFSHKNAPGYSISFTLSHYTYETQKKNAQYQVS